MGCENVKLILRRALLRRRPDLILTKEICHDLANKYYPKNVRVSDSIDKLSPEHFIRLFVTVQGMPPAGTWKTHTYVCYTDSVDGQQHFFLVPIPVSAPAGKVRPKIRFENDLLKIDDIQTQIRPQSIPYTTPFWYFHYNPNKEDKPFYSTTLNLSPSCLEKCVLCAGAKTGRVNNGMERTLSPDSMVPQIFTQHPEAKQQLESVAVVTGCFSNFEQLYAHLSDVRTTFDELSSPTTYRVLEHNVATDEQLDAIVKTLGFDVFITLECFDQNLRNIALNGKVGHKGRDSRQFLAMIKNYAEYLDVRPELGKHLVRVTYLMGLDSFDVSHYFFGELSKINQSLKHTTILPWLSIFTPYNKAMRVIQQPSFGLPFILEGMELCEKYFDSKLLAQKSGTTAEGYARGLY